ncbi:hypothetical protein NDN08_001842 [Rhodosorus marinus]|uniref:Uncharacterized protein n=1 Tax=Rhodosorus marinus TaxID=101924 RepID=A0AAV8URZ2_9RHOD|nr:hypothetical protein NDN08_001842 [Rhodosorus marinus]
MVRADMSWMFHAHNLGEYLRAVGFTAILGTFSCIAAERNKELLRKHASESSLALKKNMERRRQEIEQDVIWNETDGTRKGLIARTFEDAKNELDNLNEYRKDRSRRRTSAPVRMDSSGLPPLQDFEEFESDDTRITADPGAKHTLGGSKSEKYDTEAWPDSVFERKKEKELLP